MNKKKRINKEYLFLFTTGAVCLAFMAFTIMLFPAVIITSGENSYEVSGVFAIFGQVVTDEKLGELVFNFNPINLVGYLLPLLAVVLSVLAFKQEGLILNIISAILCVVASVTMFLEPVFFQLINPYYANYEVVISFGPIAAGILSLLSAVINISVFKIKK